MLQCSRVTCDVIFFQSEQQKTFFLTFYIITPVPGNYFFPYFLFYLVPHA